MEGFDFGENQDNMRLLMEIEDLKRALEEERNNHNLEISMLQVCYKLRLNIFIILRFLSITEVIKIKTESLKILIF